MECMICFEPYDEKLRVPKLLPCGHTNCLACLLQLRLRTTQCPQCSRNVPEPRPEELPTNYSLLSLASRRLWCHACCAEASPSCEELLHPLCGIRGRRQEQARPLMEGLERLDQALGWEESVLAAHLSLLQARRRNVRDVLTRLQEHREHLALPEDAWDALLQEALAMLSLQRDPQLLNPMQLVSIRSGEWAADGLQLQRESGLLTLALLELQRVGRLQRVQQNRPADILPTPTRPAFPAAAATPSQLSLGDVSCSPPREQEREKSATLEQNNEVDVLTEVYCQYDPGWVVALLRRHSLTLVELQLNHARREHLLELPRMPSLRRLDLEHAGEDVGAVPDAPWRGQLDWLRLLYLREETVRGLVRAHRGGLRELQLLVGTPTPAAGPRGSGGGGRAEEWHKTCDHLPDLLRQCGPLPALRTLTLRRCLWPCSRTACAAQIDAVRAVLPPGCAVTCNACT